MSRRKSFSTTAGGGVLGKGAGTAHGIMDSGWAYYKRVPSFYAKIHSGWRNDYRDRRWKGHPWNFQPIPHNQLQRNWGSWKKDRYWEKQQTWGVQGLQFRPRSRVVEPSRTVMPSQRVIEPAQPRSPVRDVRPPREVQPQPERRSNRSLSAATQRGSITARGQTSVSTASIS